MSPLFSPFSLGGLDLPNRIVMAPLTRSRASNAAADAMTALDHTQRASAGLIVSEGTTISREGRGYLFNPGIFSPEQIAGWKTVTDSVHGAGGHMFAQLWHVGRARSASGSRPMAGCSTWPPTTAPRQPTSRWRPSSTAGASPTST